MHPSLKFFFATFAAVYLTPVANAQDPRTLSGVVDAITGEGDSRVVMFRAAKSNVNLRLTALSADVRAIVEGEPARKSVVRIDVDAAAIVAETPVLHGVRSDCSELPLSYPELETLANSPSVNNTLDLLKAVPEGTLQGFTFVYNSLSAQRGSGDSIVSPQWPRVLRTSKDGKLTFSYTCNPASETYNKIEVLHWDDATDAFKTSRFDFTSEPGIGSRVLRDPQTCVTCHSASTINGKPSLKPNWPEYFFWADCNPTRDISFYGSSDDGMRAGVARNRLPTHPNKLPATCNTATDLAAHNVEVQNWDQFRTAQKDNPCFAMLPWAENVTAPADNTTFDYRRYPYSDAPQTFINNIQNYSLRTNARMTDFYSHLMARRLARLIRESPDYDKIKYFLQLEASACSITAADDAKMVELLPGIDVSRRSTGAIYDYTDSAKARYLYGFSLRMGLQPADWSMEFERDKGPVYNAVMFKSRFGGDANISDVVQGDLLLELAKEDQAVAALTDGVLTRGITDVFGGAFSCIDDLGGAVREERKAGLCPTLRSRNAAHLAAMVVTEPTDPIDPPPVDPINVDVLTPEEVESGGRGKDLVQDGTAKCLTCHSRTSDNVSARPDAFLFVPNNALAAAENEIALQILRQRAAEGFLADVKAVLVDSEDMPPTGDLTGAQRQDVYNYLRMIAR